jgi:hypothetical protein
MKTYFYYCQYPEPGLQPDSEQATMSWSCDDEIQAINGSFIDLDSRWMVEDIAKHYYHNLDGWDYNNWASGRESMVFFIFDEDKQFLFSTMVDIETEPVFNAGNIEVNK